MAARCTDWVIVHQKVYHIAYVLISFGLGMARAFGYFTRRLIALYFTRAK